MTPSLAASLGLGLLVAAALVVAWVVAGRPRVWAWLPWVVGGAVAVGMAYLTRKPPPKPSAPPEPVDKLKTIAEEVRRREQARAVEEHEANTEEIRAEVEAGDGDALAARLNARHRGRGKRQE